MSKLLKHKYLTAIIFYIPFIVMKRIRFAALSITVVALTTAGGFSGVTIAESDSGRVQTHDPIVESVVADKTNEAAGTFTGTVTDEDGNPISQAQLRTSGEFVVIVDDDGTFESDVWPGEHEVTVITSDRRTTETVAIEANETTNRTITLETSETKTASNSTTDGNSSSDGETSDDDGLPGFGVTAGVVALLGALLVFRRS